MVSAGFRRRLHGIDAADAGQAERTTAVILMREGGDDFVLRCRLPRQAQAVVLEVFVVVGHAAQIGFVEQGALSLVEVAALYIPRGAPPSVGREEPKLVLLDRTAERRTVVVRPSDRNVRVQTPQAQL